MRPTKVIKHEHGTSTLSISNAAHDEMRLPPTHGGNRDTVNCAHDAREYGLWCVCLTLTALRGRLLRQITGSIVDRHLVDIGLVDFSLTRNIFLVLEKNFRTSLHQQYDVTSVYVLYDII